MSVKDFEEIRLHVRYLAEVRANREALLLFGLQL